MSFIYSKEILDGVSSRRKFFGIPIYIRNDILGVITRKYFLGIWKTVTYPEGKRYYLFGIKVKNKGKTYDLPKNITSTYNVQNTSKVSADNLNSNKPKPKISDNIINSVSTTPELQGLYKQITDLTSTVNLLKDKLNLCYYETANFKNLVQCQHLHQKVFGPYRNAFKGRNVVLVATGPTAKYYRPIKDAIYVGVNNACLLDNVELDYLFCQDFYMGEEKIDKIVHYRAGKCKKFFGRIPDNRIEACHRSKDAQHVRRCPRYLVDEAEASEYYVEKTKKKAEEILNTADGSESLFDYLLTIHNEILKNAEYDYTLESDGAYEAFGVLTAGSGVCESYSRAYQYLCQCIGVDNLLIVGTSNDEPHMWNMVMLGGEWYHADLTWDDGDNGGIEYYYFAFNDKNLKDYGCLLYTSPSPRDS